jgi:hypothetical protein
VTDRVAELTAILEAEIKTHRRLLELLKEIRRESKDECVPLKGGKEN